MGEGAGRAGAEEEGREDGDDVRWLATCARRRYHIGLQLH